MYIYIHICRSPSGNTCFFTFILQPYYSRGENSKFYSTGHISAPTLPTPSHPTLPDQTSPVHALTAAHTPSVTNSGPLLLDPQKFHNQPLNHCIPRIAHLLRSTPPHPPPPNDPKIQPTPQPLTHLSPSNDSHNSIALISKNSHSHTLPIKVNPNKKRF